MAPSFKDFIGLMENISVWVVVKAATSSAFA
jgi:hypothetical protein